MKNEIMGNLKLKLQFKAIKIKKMGINLILIGVLFFRVRV